MRKNVPSYNKYFATNHVNNFFSAVVDNKVSTNNDVNTVEKHTVKNKERIETLKTFDLIYFLGKSFQVKMNLSRYILKDICYLKRY